jgi:hypothetical protein
MFRTGMCLMNDEELTPVLLEKAPSPVGVETMAVKQHGAPFFSIRIL